MFYDAMKNDHGLRYDPFKAIVAPRPIGWVTSMSAKGEINLAPYSYFNGVSSRPAMIMFSSEGRKDSVAFVEETREFVCSLTTRRLRHCRAASMRWNARASSLRRHGWSNRHAWPAVPVRSNASF